MNTQQETRKRVLDAAGGLVLLGEISAWQDRRQGVGSMPEVRVLNLGPGAALLEYLEIEWRSDRGDETWRHTLTRGDVLVGGQDMVVMSGNLLYAMSTDAQDAGSSFPPEYLAGQGPRVFTFHFQTSSGPSRLRLECTVKPYWTADQQYAAVFECGLPQREPAPGPAGS